MRRFGELEAVIMHRPWTGGRRGSTASRSGYTAALLRAPLDHAARDDSDGEAE